MLRSKAVWNSLRSLPTGILEEAGEDSEEVR